MSSSSSGTCSKNSLRRVKPVRPNRSDPAVFTNGRVGLQRPADGFGQPCGGAGPAQRIAEDSGGPDEEEIARIQKQKQKASVKTTPKKKALRSPAAGIYSQNTMEILEVLLHEPAFFAQVQEKIGAEDFGPDGPLREIADALFG